MQKLRGVLAEEPSISRRQLSLRLCQWMDWKDAQGSYQQMTARTVLRALHERQMIVLPPVQPLFEKTALRTLKTVAFTPPVLDVSLAELGPVELVVVTAAQRELSQLWNTLISRYHPLGYSPMAGAQIRYLVRCPHGWIGALGFGASAKTLRARDRFIGWSPAEQQRHLGRIVCNWRFLILPTVRVKYLASHLLSLCARQLPEDWGARYGYSPWMLETFVGAEYRGSCYAAANWICVGPTTGRGRNDRQHQKAKGIKTIYLYPLHREWKKLLTGRSVPSVVAEWVKEEFASARLPDQRLHRRLETVTRDFYRHPEANLPEACGTLAKTKAAYRFFAHPKVQAQDILQAHQQATLQRAKAYPVILAVQDSTGASYGKRPGTAGLGPMDTDQDSARGLWVHTTMAYTPEGVALGILEMQAWSRAETKVRRAQAHRNDLPIEKKESYKWLKSFRATQACQVQIPGVRMVSVGDRESDLYELLVEATLPTNTVDLLIRVQHKKRIVRGEKNKLWDHVASQAVQGTMEVEVPRRFEQPAREAVLEIRFCRVELQRFRQKKRSIGLWAMHAREKEPTGKGKPIDWMLLTNIPVHTTAEAIEKVRWYSQRFKIEGFHRILKSGCRIEKRQFLCADALRQCLGIDMIVAWRIAFLSKFGRENPTLPCGVAFDADEWASLYCFKNLPAPQTEPGLQEMVREVAKLGGFLARKRDGQPGAQTLWRGLQRLSDIVQTWRAVLNRLKNPETMDLGP